MLEPDPMKQLLKKILGPVGLNYLNDRFDRVSASHIALQVALDAQGNRLSAEIAGLRESLVAPQLSPSGREGWRENIRYQAIVQSGLFARAERGMREHDARYPPVVAPTPVDVKAFEDYLSDLKALCPSLYPAWQILFENGQRAYRELPKEASCSTWNNEFAMLFRDFVDTYGTGAMLDIGCGPYGDPVYFSGRAPRSLAAIEPLPMESQAAFTVVRAFCEFLPWNDDSFDTVVVATSLDHVLSLKKSLQEIHRVLKPGGKVLIWLGSLPGMKEYDEQDSVPLDDFHLFQFDEKWATPLFTGYFSLVDLARFKAPGCDWHHCFYCLQK